MSAWFTWHVPGLLGCLYLRSYYCQVSAVAPNTGYYLSAYLTQCIKFSQNTCGPRSPALGAPFSLEGNGSDEDGLSIGLL